MYNQLLQLQCDILTNRKFTNKTKHTSLHTRSTLSSFQRHKVYVNVLNSEYNIAIATNLYLQKYILPLFLFFLFVRKPSAIKGWYTSKEKISIENGISVYNLRCTALFTKDGWPDCFSSWNHSTMISYIVCHLKRILNKQPTLFFLLKYMIESY